MLTKNPTVPPPNLDVKSLSRVRLFATSWTLAYPLCPWHFPGNSTIADCHFLLQGIFPTQGSNPGLPNCRQTLYHLSHQGSPNSHASPIQMLTWPDCLASETDEIGCIHGGMAIDWSCFSRIFAAAFPTHPQFPVLTALLCTHILL